VSLPDWCTRFARQAATKLAEEGRYASQHRGAAALGLGMAALAFLGLLVLGRSLAWVVAGGLLAAIVVAALPTAWKGRVLEVVGAVLVGIATLIGVNVVVDGLVHTDEDAPSWFILVGLLFAVVVFWFAAYQYLLRRGHWPRRPAGGFALILAIAFVFGLPALIALLKDDAASHRIPRAQGVPSQLDVFIVVDANENAPPPDLSLVPPVREFDVRYSVGFADGRRVRWTLVGGRSEAMALRAATTQGKETRAAPAPRKGADHVLVLVPDGTPPVVADPTALSDVGGRNGEVRRWEDVAASAGLGDVPALALLQTTGGDRLRRWEDLGAVSVQAFGSRTLTDAAVRLAIAAPTATEDFSQALEHQPVLLFDEQEQVPRPMSIEALFAGGKIKQCALRARGDHCGDPLTNPAKLVNGGERLEIERPRQQELRQVALTDRARLRAPTLTLRAPAATAGGRASAPEAVSAPAPVITTMGARPRDLPGEPLSRIYVHPVTRQIDRHSLLFLDYWWYLPANPARSGWGAFCGAGLVVPGISCFDHESDWEGVTVVVDRTRVRGRQTTPEPVAVYYAQHNSVVRYEWSQLRTWWDDRKAAIVKSVPGGRERPLVFVARGTHASYPTPCRGGCRQTATGNEERPHTGTLVWAGNNARTCGHGSACLAPLPTLIGGSRPALWNAFRGPWGKTRCFLDFYCNSALPPSAPGTQPRYKRPWACDGRVPDLARNQRGFKRREGCLDD
jgi:hypothetical protein